MRARSLGFAIALLVFALDQLSKWYVLGPLHLQELRTMHAVSGWPADMPDIPILSIFGFTYTENQGISLGLLNATNPVGRWMLVALTSAIAVAVAVWIGKEKNRIEQIALGMVLGGALGNILDRVRHGFVTDFLDLHFGEFRPFLIFNVGDAAISIAVVILLLRAFLTRKDDAKGPGPEETIEHA